MDRIHINVSGIANSQMKTSLENALDKIEGVQMVNIDIARQTVEVGFNNPANIADIENCVVNTGIIILT